MQRLLYQSTGLRDGLLWSAAGQAPNHHAHMLFVGGRFGGATVRVEISPDAHQWYAHAAVQERTALEMPLPVGVYFRVGIENPSTETRLDATYV